jgi:hypothetical protein
VTALPATRPRTVRRDRGTAVNVIRLNVPPDQTPEEEARLVAEIAASYTESTGSDEVTVEVQRSEEVDYRSVQARFSSRWAG